MKLKNYSNALRGLEDTLWALDIIKDDQLYIDDVFLSHMRDYWKRNGVVFINYGQDIYNLSHTLYMMRIIERKAYFDTSFSHKLFQYWGLR